jgi:hypothetical protein
MGKSLERIVLYLSAIFVSDDVICLQWFHLSAMVSFVSNGVICQQQRRVSSQRVEQWWFATNRYGG